MVKAWELDSLPERLPYDEERVQNADGTVTIIPSLRDVVATSLEDDDVIAFVGTDGRAMFIGHDSGGAYKYPA